MTTAAPSLGIGIGELAGQSWRATVANLGKLIGPSALTLGVYALSLVLIPTIEDPWASFGASVAALVVATTISYPWFLAALRAVDPDSDLRFEIGRFSDQLVASLFFWGGALFGLRYLYGLPAVVVVLFYAFFGYAVADEPRRGAMKALGWSVHIGQRRRFKLLGIGIGIAFLNLLAVSPVGAGLNPLTIGLSAVLVLVTANLSMVAGAYLYRALEEGARS